MFWTKGKCNIPKMESSDANIHFKSLPTVICVCCLCTDFMDFEHWSHVCSILMVHNGPRWLRAELIDTVLSLFFSLCKRRPLWTKQGPIQEGHMIQPTCVPLRGPLRWGLCSSVPLRSTRVLLRGPRLAGGEYDVTTLVRLKSTEFIINKTS